jgi:hypothetical protein
MTRQSLEILTTDTILMKDRDAYTLSSEKSVIEVYLSANEPSTLRDEYS